MTHGRSVERMAEGIVRLLTELARRKDPSEPSTHELTTSQAQAMRLDHPRRAAASGLARKGARRDDGDREPDRRRARRCGSRTPRAGPAGRTRRPCRPDRAGRREHQVRYRRFVRALERLSDELSEVERRQLADALETLGRLFGAEPEAQAPASAGRPKS